MKKLKVGFVGLGCRGRDLINTTLHIPEMEIVAACDLYEDRVADTVKRLKEYDGRDIFATLDYKELVNCANVDAVIITTAWESHCEIACYAMRAGKITAMEVGGAYNLEEVWELVDTQEKTKTPFMFLENCCFGEYELMITNMVRQGLFGDISHCSGSYAHDLRDEITTGKEKRHYRLRNYIARNCENYPTHELGPIAKLLGVNRGNRMTRLVSISSKQQGLTDFVRRNPETIDQSLLDVKFAQGDVVNTLIECEDGSTISLKLDTSLPRFYSREFTVHGTKGYYSELANAVFLDGDEEHFNAARFRGNGKEYIEKYSAPIWKNLSDEDRKLGHGGMDYFELKQFAEFALSGKPFTVDVYDAASWMAVTCLSEQSIKEGRWVDIPDFTRGNYKERPLEDVVELR